MNEHARVLHLWRRRSDEQLAAGEAEYWHHRHGVGIDAFGVVIDRESCPIQVFKGPTLRDPAGYRHLTRPPDARSDNAGLWPEADSRRLAQR